MPQFRVLFVLGTLWGENGITSHLLTLSKALIQQNWEVALACNLASSIEGSIEESTRAIQLLESHGIKHFLIPFPALRLTPQNMVDGLNALRLMNTALQEFKPDVIHIHSLSVAPYIQVMKVLHHLPSVSTCHMEPKSSRLNVKLSIVLNKKINKIYGDRMIAISSELKQAFQTILKVSDERIRLICHGIDDDYFRPPSPEERAAAREKFGLAVDTLGVCLIGRLAAVKGHDLLIEAIAILKSQGINAIALCAGKGYGEEEAKVRMQSSKLGVSDQIHLLGMTDARQVLWASNVIVLPSRKQTEAFPLVIPEAMLCGVVPVRTPAAGAFDQIEEGVSGFIVPFDDPQALADRLKRILTNQALRSQMSETALAIARKKFTVERMAQDTIALYKEVIKEKI